MPSAKDKRKQGKVQRSASRRAGILDGVTKDGLP